MAAIFHPPSPRRSPGGFTLVEVLLAFGLMIFMTLVAYKIFFSQARMVTQSIEFLQVNDNFRKILMYLGNDIREANQIILPVPVDFEKSGDLTTHTGVVLQLLKQEVDPTLKFTEPNGQIGTVREIIYELESHPNPQAKTVPRFKLIRTEYIQGKSGDGQRTEVVDNARDFVLYRTIRRPPRPKDTLKGIADRLFTPEPPDDNGTGNSVLHLKVLLERTRQKDKDADAVYQIALTTSFYKRGKEIWLRQ